MMRSLYKKDNKSKFMQKCIVKIRKCNLIKLKKLYLVFICIVGIVSFVVWYSLPKEINQAFDGIVYGVGSKSNQIDKEVAITIKGKMYRKIFNQDRFKGTIDINGEVPTNIIIDKKQVEVVFIENGGSLLFGDSSYGILYINKDFSELSIIVYELIESERDNASYSWDPEDGLLISGPATSRTEALSISNELIGDLLKPLE
jgi:hypothetical protein